MTAFLQRTVDLLSTLGYNLTNLSNDLLVERLLYRDSVTTLDTQFTNQHIWQ